MVNRHADQDPLPWIDNKYRLPRETTLKVLARISQAQPAGIHGLEALHARLDTESGLADDSLDRKECKAVAALMASVDNAPLRDLCRGLRAVAKASAIELKLEQEIAAREERYRVFERPGAFWLTGASAGVGAQCGLPFGASFGLGGELGKATQDVTDDILNTQTIRQTSIKGRGGAEVGFTSEFGAEISGSVDYNYGHLCEWGTANDRAAIKARARINRVPVMGRLIHSLRPFLAVFGISAKPMLGRYDIIKQHADSYRDTLPMLLSKLDIKAEPATWQVPTGVPPKPLHAILTIAKATGQLSASLPVASSDISGTRSIARISAEIKTDFSTYLDDETQATEPGKQRFDALKNRAERLWSSSEANSPQCRLEWKRPGVRRSLEEALQLFEAETSHYEQIARYNDLHPKQAGAAAIEKSLAVSWLADSREDVLIHMLDMHAGLKSAAVLSGDMEAGSALEETFARIAYKLYNMRIRHDSDRVHEATCVTDHLTQKIDSNTVSLSVGAGPEFVKAKIGGSVTHMKRDDPNPLREGRYIDIELEFSGTASPAALIGTVLGSLKDKVEDAVFEEVSSYLAMHSSDIEAGVGVQIRFFKPAYQWEKSFPGEAKGYRFQTARFYHDRSGSLGARVPLPVFAGVTATVDLRAHRSTRSLVREQFGSHTLTGPLLRYMRLRSVSDPEGSWDKFCKEQESSLTGLMKALGKSSSNAAQEAAYWDKKRVGDQPKHPIFEQMTDFLEKRSDTKTAIGHLTAFFADLQEPFKTMKRNSPLIVPEPLV
jgi:hypothetical protein